MEGVVYSNQEITSYFFVVSAYWSKMVYTEEGLGNKKKDQKMYYFSTAVVTHDAELMT